MPFHCKIPNAIKYIRKIKITRNLTTVAEKTNNLCIRVNINERIDVLQFFFLPNELYDLYNLQEMNYIL